MSNQESVIKALMVAIENSPADVSLRLHVASLVLADGFIPSLTFLRRIYSSAEAS